MQKRNPSKHLLERLQGNDHKLELLAKLDALPDHPGIYLFKNSSGEVIYVGKAKNLRNRVRSYFTTQDDGRYQFPQLVAAIRDVEVLLTRNEVEALKTEQAVIKRYKPRYNVELRDDKSFLYLKITNEPYPRIILTRKPHTKDGAYFGPFTDVRAIKTLVRTLKGTLQIRDCNLPLTESKIAQNRFKVCLDYHIGKCGGPCEGKVSAEQYANNINGFLDFLHGKMDEVIASLETEMRNFAADTKFEEAAATRDRWMAVRRFADRLQKVDPNPIFLDAINFVREDNTAIFTVINVRGGRIVGQSPFYLNKTENIEDIELLETFLVQHYELVKNIPDQILIPIEITNYSSLTSYLSSIKSKKVEIKTPQRGEKNQLVQLALTNAEHLLLQRQIIHEKRDFIPQSIKSLQEHLNLPLPPINIEAFDISHLQGVDTVASMVYFRNGKPLKSAYRLFKIRSVNGIDDFASIGEAVLRRYNRIKTNLESKNNAARELNQSLNEQISEEEPDQIDLNMQFPDLILIDGGSGQLNRARQVLNDLGLNDLKVIGLAKRLEEIFIPNIPEPLSLPRTSSALRLLQQIRDEAHRFAITKHRLLRGKRQVKSKLDDIEGIGAARRHALLTKFGSIKRIREAELSEIANVKGMTKSTAQKVKEYLEENAF